MEGIEGGKGKWRPADK